MAMTAANRSFAAIEDCGPRRASRSANSPPGNRSGGTRRDRGQMGRRAEEALDTSQQTSSRAKCCSARSRRRSRVISPRTPRSWHKLPRSWNLGRKSCFASRSSSRVADPTIAHQQDSRDHLRGGRTGTGPRLGPSSLAARRKRLSPRRSGTKVDGQRQERIEDPNFEKVFMVHYNFPPFSVGETGLHAWEPAGGKSDTDCLRNVH